MKEMAFKKEIPINEVVKIFDNEFRIKETDADPAMSRFVPMVYDPIGFDWKAFFERDFIVRFNGLMINGGKSIKKVVCVVFLNDGIVQEVISRREDGVMIFAHHPIQMECGDPQGKMGRGFLPVNPELLKKLKQQGISVYTCHAPLDAGSISGLGTPEAIVKRLNATVTDQYYPYSHGYAARICELPQTLKTSELVKKLKGMTGLPYVDLQGVQERDIKTVVVLPGGGGDFEDIKSAEDKGADCVITGEVTAKIKGERGDKERALFKKYYPKAKISAIGLSHAGSEFVVMHDIAGWIKNNLGIKAEALPERNWWR
jgi:putative NIF3 family GTP cyclohydrolase 1 type 2